MEEKRNFKIGKEELLDILATAFYGSDWFTADLSSKDYAAYSGLVEDGSYEDVWVEALFDGKKLHVTDLEEGDKHKISLEDIQRGLEIVRDEEPHFYADYITYCDDFYTMDAIIQCAIFGEVVYG